MANPKNLNLFIFLTTISVLFMVPLVFAQESAGMPQQPVWHLSLYGVAAIIAFVVVMQGVKLIAVGAGGTLAKAFLWYPVGAMFMALAVIAHLINEITTSEIFPLHVIFELSMFAGLVMWLIGTQKALNALKGQ